MMTPDRFVKKLKRTVNFITQDGDFIKIDCLETDTILNLKHLLFIEKDMDLKGMKI